MQSDALMPVLMARALKSVGAIEKSVPGRLGVYAANRNMSKDDKVRWWNGRNDGRAKVYRRV